jgi:hypothetical protein
MAFIELKGVFEDRKILPLPTRLGCAFLPLRQPNGWDSSARSGISCLYLPGPLDQHRRESARSIDDVVTIFSRMDPNMMADFVLHSRNAA